MNHVTELLSAYLDGEINPAEKTAVETHLPQCKNCRQRLEELRSLVAQLKASSFEPPAGLAQRIKNKLGKAPAHSPSWTWARLATASSLWRPAAAVAFAGLLGAFMIRQFQNSAQQLSAPISSASDAGFKKMDNALEMAQSASDEIMKETASAPAQRQRLPGMTGALSAALGSLKDSAPDLPFKGLPPPPEDESCSKKEPKPCGKITLGENYTSRGWMGDEGPPEKQMFLVQSEADWKKAWAKVSKQSPPQIDFEKEMAAIVFGGKLPGYIVAINGSEEMPEGKIIIYHRITPPNPMLKTRSGDFPYAIRTFPKTTLPVEFQEQ